MTFADKRSCREFFRFRSRRGQSLILIFFVLLALVGVLALTMDFGFVILARRQMQTGVNAAALEGLRDQGDLPYDGEDELERRENARRLLRLNYDDDFDLSENRTTIGAGIDRSLIQGDGYQATTIGNGTGLKDTLDNRSNFIFRPDAFQLNLDNDRYGDIVVGRYISDDTSHAEANDYKRDDFQIAGDKNAPSPFVPDALLIRLRRTHDPDGLDQVEGTSSRGGGLPLMMGLLGWMKAEPVDAAYSIRRDGVLVRATAISNVKPANIISPAFPADLALPVALLPGLTMLGPTPFVVAATDWDGSSPIDAEIQANGVSSNNQVRLTGLTTIVNAIDISATTLQVTSASGFPIDQTPFRIRINNELLTIVDASGTTWTVERGALGTNVASHDVDDIAILHSGRRVGEPVVTLTSELPQNTDLNGTPGKPFHAYLPLFADINGVDRIVGFRPVNWTWNDTKLTINPIESSLAARGASATIFAAGLGSDDLCDLLTMQTRLSNLLLAPILVPATR